MFPSGEKRASKRSATWIWRVYAPLVALLALLVSCAGRDSGQASAELGSAADAGIDASTSTGSAAPMALAALSPKATRPTSFDSATGVPVWEELGNASSPPGRAEPTMAYDSARGRVVLFGGSDSHHKGDTWEWNWVSWTRVATTGPSPRDGHAMAYDAARKKVVLFGGYGASGTHLGDTWEWDGVSWTLVATSGPSRRTDAEMAFDGTRGKVILFGGATSSFDPDQLKVITHHWSDTWEWDGSAWTQVSATGPSPRCDHAMASDSARGKVVLFGGITDHGVTDGPLEKVGDTWEWDGAVWTEVSTTGPSARTNHALVYDAHRERTVLFGGLDFAKDRMGDTWEWDGTVWTQVATSGPSPRIAPGMAYDAGRAKIVLFGGQGGVPSMPDDTWEFDGTSWTHIVPGITPRYRHAVAYDEARERIVLFGGQKPPYEVLGETWQWNGEGWSLVSTTGPAPRNDFAMAYDAANQKVVLFGGIEGSRFGDTWTWDGTSWTLAATTGPSPRCDVAMAYDAKRERVVLFGGSDTTPPYYQGDTWEWDGQSWTQVATTGPSGRYDHAMAYDPERERVVLFGGYDANYEDLGDTWEWDGQSWTEVATTGPSPRHEHTMTYDAMRRRVVLFGGRDKDWQVFGDTWEWDGQSWTKTAETGPSVRTTQMAYDAARKATILFGGYGKSGSLGDTWAYRTRAGTCSCPGGGNCATEDCPSGYCVDGVCCEGASLTTTDPPSCGTCERCDSSANPGICEPVRSADDPDSCAAPNTCGPEGTCGLPDGEPCTPGVTTCASGHCVDGFCCDAACDGACDVCNAGTLGWPEAVDGVCTIAPAGYPSTCAPYTCDGTNASCAVGCASDAECVASSHCSELTELCEDDFATGAPCSRAAQCESGFCVDGVCCDGACDGICEACTAAAKATGTGDGECGPVKEGTDPDDDCPDDGAASCQRDGVCDGAGACRLYASGTECKAADCGDGNAPTTYACDGSGTCVSESEADCAPNLCVDGACATTCSTNDDCAEDAICDDGICVTKSELGEACTSADECVSGHCVDGFCCDSACLDQCAACDAPGSEGTCTAIVGAPHGDRPACESGDENVCAAAQCDGTTTTSCTGFVNEGQPCREASCTDGVETLPASCDGQGSCPAAQTRECAPYVCKGSACATSCESDADCAGPHVCDSNGECVLPASEDVVAEQDGGCGCRVAGRKGTGWAPVAGFGVAFLLARARRRRRVGAA